VDKYERDFFGGDFHFFILLDTAHTTQQTILAHTHTQTSILHVSEPKVSSLWINLHYTKLLYHQHTFK